MNILFIVEGSLSNPILFSQGIPHIQENSKRGIHYSVLSFEDVDYLDQDINAKERYNAARFELMQCAKVFPIELKKNKLLIFLRLMTLRVLFLGVLSGIRIVKKNRIDIIHGRSNLPTLIALFIKKLININVLYDNRGLVSDEFGEKRWLRIVVETLIEKYLLKNADAIVVVSNAFKYYLNSKYQTSNSYDKIRIIENSFSEKRFKYSDQTRQRLRKEQGLEDKFVMVYSGPSVFWQRFDLVLTTFKLLKELKKDSFLLVVSYDLDIKKAILNSGIDSLDFSVHNVPAAEVNNYLMIGDFGVIYRDERIRSKVCAPIKLGEYLASGLPILCMDKIGDTDDIVTGYNVGVIVTDENEIENKLKKIVELIKDPNIRIRCRRAAEERLSLRISAQKYYSIYNDLFDGRFQN